MFRLYSRSIFLILLVSCLLSACKRSSGSYSSYTPSSTPSANTSATPNVSSNGTPANTAPITHLSFTRPALVVYRGEHFHYAVPAGWQVAESENGIDMKSPDERMAATAVMLKGALGTTDSWKFVYNSLAWLGCTNIKGNFRVDLPAKESAYPGLYWETSDYDLTYTDPKGIARHADFVSAVCNGYDHYDALLQGFATVPELFDDAKTWLPVVSSSVNANDPNSVAYQHQVIPVQNHPLDNSGLMESWREKRLSEDRIAKAQREGMMGYERMVSPSTGRYYNMPLETYDGAYGGYHNPDHPEEILKPTEPGN